MATRWSYYRTEPDGNVVSMATNVADVDLPKMDRAMLEKARAFATALAPKGDPVYRKRGDGTVVPVTTLDGVVLSLAPSADTDAPGRIRRPSTSHNSRRCGTWPGRVTGLGISSTPT